MPIRMTDDEDKDGNKKSKGKGSSSFSSLPLVGALFSLVFKYPKLMIPLILLLGFLSLPTLCNKEDTSYSDPTSTENETEETLLRPKGAIFDAEKYASAKTYQPLEEGFGNKIPKAISLRQYAPEPRNQGSQGSCVGWAVSYAARTILEAKATGLNPNSVAFSPAHPFNQNTSAKCDGSYPSEVLEDLKKEGALPFAEFPYNETTCRTKLNSNQRERAKVFRVEGYQRLTKDGDNYNTDINSVKQYLASGSPVIITMDVGGTFNQLSSPDWIPSNNDYKKVKQFQNSGKRDRDWGPHAMTIIAYDDDRNGGSVQIMNSWGSEWAEKGTFWFRYSDFDTFVLEAFSIYPSVSAKNQESKNLRFGLIDNSSKDFIPLKKLTEIHYETKSPIKVGTRFKVSIENDSPVFVYIFGKEVDGSSYVLFPYNDKHSPYCGPNGVRVFPRKQSLEADKIGKRDTIAVVFSYQNIDYKDLNSLINKTDGIDLGKRLQTVLATKLSSTTKFSSNGKFIELNSKEKDSNKIHLMIIDFDKFE